MKKFFFLVFLFSPLFCLAGTYNATIGGVATVITYEGLVPCGECASSSVAISASTSTAEMCGIATGVLSQTVYVPCQFCHFFVMFSEIINFVLFKIVVPLAIFFFALGGIMYVLALFELVGGPQLLSQAKGVLFGVAVGVVIAFGSWALINLFFQFIGVADWTGLKTWWQINCPIEI